MLTNILDLRTLYKDIIVILSPPRCSSTALARVFWEHPDVRYYSHEPFETTYYQGEPIQQAIKKMRSPLDLKKNRVKRHINGSDETTLIVKEMPYQVGKHMEALIELATRPVIFLIRDPRLNIASRIQKKREVGDSPHFPLIETGWELLKKQIEHCEQQGKDFMLVDSNDFRNHPEPILKQLFERLGMQFHRDQVVWDPHPEVELDNLGGQHTHLYGKVLRSNWLRPDNASVEPLEYFPKENGLRQHVLACLEIYSRLRKHPARIRLS